MATLLLLLLLVLSASSAASVAAAAHHHHHHHHHFRPSTDPKAVDSLSTKITQACSATRYPDVCATTLSQSPSLPPNTSATDLILASADASSSGLSTALYNAQSILTASSSDPNRTNAARNCLELLSYSSRRLSSAASSVPYGRLADSRTWAGAALLYQYDCWSALKYVNGTQQVADAMSFLVHLTNLTSNALSMLASLHRYGPDVSLWSPPQTERNGYWGEAAGGVGSAAAAGLRREFPSADAPNATVCLDGGCAYPTVQAAVDAAPEGSPGPYVIHIASGVYRETVRIPYEKTNIVFLGDGIGKTVITGSLSADMVGVSTYNTATVGVSGDGFMARGLTFENTAGPDAHQAVAFRSDSDLSVLDSVEFAGHQDTLYPHSLRQYYRRCLVSGTVDFIFGNAAAVFDECVIVVVPRQLNPEKGETDTVTAHGRTDPAQPTGFVFRGCVIKGSEEYTEAYLRRPAAHKVYLGRPWKEYSRTVLIGCTLGEVVRPEGWVAWSGDFALSTLFYGEFGSKGPAADAAARVAWSSQIPPEHVGVYSVENFIQGNQWIPSAEV